MKQQIIITERSVYTQDGKKQEHIVKSMAVITKEDEYLVQYEITERLESLNEPTAFAPRFSKGGAYRNNPNIIAHLVANGSLTFI